MLQRPQSLYLFVVFILSVLLLTGPIAFITQSEGGLFLKHSGVFDLTDQKLDVASWPLTAMIALSIIVSLGTFLSYMNRARQMRLTLFLMFFDLGIIALSYYYVSFVMKNFDGIKFVFQWRVVIPIIILVLLILAFRGIRKDDLLVKAADRIR